MKKHLFVLTFIVSVIVLCMFVSCNNNVPNETESNVNDNRVLHFY